jgi:raffinose/stachyose/melibiose transport system permease protein
MVKKTSKLISYIILVGPGIFIYSLIIVFPVIFCFVLSFTQWSGYGTPVFIEIQNYTRILKDPIFWHGVRNNFLIVAISVFGQIPLGFILAYIIYRKMIRTTGFFKAMIFLPITISAIVVAILFKKIFDPSGLLTQLFRYITGDHRYVLSIFESRNFAIMPILFVILWMFTGMYMIIFIANLQKISPSILEAAMIDGASELQILGGIILPGMLGILFTTAVFAITGSLKSFGLIYAMTGGGPAHYTEVISIYMYDHTFRYYNYGFGSAVSVMIVILSLGLISLLTGIFNRFQKKYG